MRKGWLQQTGHMPVNLLAGQLKAPACSGSEKSVRRMRVTKHRADGNMQALRLRNNWLYKLYYAPAE